MKNYGDHGTNPIQCQAALASGPCVGCVGGRPEICLKGQGAYYRTLGINMLVAAGPQPDGFTKSSLKD